MLRQLNNLGRWIWVNTDPLTKWLQVVAIIITTGWVFFKFSRGEAPSLELRSSLESTLDSTLAADSSAKWCDVHYKVTVRSEGITSFDVTEVHIQAWWNELPRPIPGKPFFLDPRELQKGKSVIDISPPSSLCRHFSPQQTAWQTFDWIWTDKPQPGLYIFQAVIQDRHGAQLGLAQTWTDHLCVAQRR